MTFAPLPPVAVPGQPLATVDTPALLLDLDAFERNLDCLQAATDAAGVRLRPHAKAHKCPAVALAQMARGAVGVCCQKASEALPFLQAGVADVHISNQLASPAMAAQVAGWAREARLSVCVDDARQIDVLGAATLAAGSRLGVFIEIDIGQGRCGVADADAVLHLLDAVARHPSLDFAGLQAYHGGVQHVRNPVERRDTARRAADRAAQVRDALAQRGIGCPTLTGGGTGSVAFDLTNGVYTEVQPGSYAFMDRDYADNEPDPSEPALRFEHALFLATTVMSTAAGAHAVVDAGLKSLAVDSGLPSIWPPRMGWEYRQANDEHGLVCAQPGAMLPALGTRVTLVPGHCDPTFNLHDDLVCFRGDTVEAVWPIAARGLSR